MKTYPTDEELQKLIEELEQQQLYAPRHLKDEILLKVKDNADVRNGSNHQVSFFVYTCKMVAGMAAALFLIFTIPSREISIEEQLQSGRDKMTTVTDKISSVMDVIFQRDDLGGYDNEN